MDASTAALPEYCRQLKALRDDDLPRFEARFKELLNKETINSMAAFQAYLQRRRDEIEERIRIINSSLTSIEYDRMQATYIELVSLPPGTASCFAEPHTRSSADYASPNALHLSQLKISRSAPAKPMQCGDSSS